MIDCPIIRQELNLSQEEYNSLYSIAMSIYYGYWQWEHACNVVHKSSCEMSEDMFDSDEEYNKHILEHFESAIKEINSNPHHCGDCTKDCCPCIICHIEEYFTNARLVRDMCK